MEQSILVIRFMRPYSVSEKPDLSITETDLHELCYSDLLITYIAVHRD